MATVHTYRTALAWSGSTAGGYRAYDRAHRVSAHPAEAGLDVSADPSFGGVPALLNPEQLLLAAAASCQLLSFLALAARAGIDVLHYEDDSEAVMPVTREPMRITAIVLRPRIVVAEGTDVEQVSGLVHTAHEECFIANSLAVPIDIHPSVELRPTTVS